MLTLKGYNKMHLIRLCSGLRIPRISEKLLIGSVEIQRANKQHHNSQLACSQRDVLRLTIWGDERCKVEPRDEDVNLHGLYLDCPRVVQGVELSELYAS